MPVSLQGFQKKKEYLICVDSDPMQGAALP